MKRSSRRKSGVSKAVTYRAMGDFWDKHDLSDFWNKTRPVTLSLRSLFMPSKRVFPRLFAGQQKKEVFLPVPLLTCGFRRRFRNSN